MSCQQLDDPYVFTDTISNPSNFMQQNNSQTKYVPLNRQTIYSRQFKNHEPSVPSDQLQKSPTQKFPTNQQKIVIQPSAVNGRKNGLKNGTIISPASSPSSSPKFFKTHDMPSSFKVPDGQYLMNSCSKPTVINHQHSIAAVSQLTPTPLNSQQQYHQQIKNESQFNHVAMACENGIGNTGIKQGLTSHHANGNRSKGMLTTGVLKKRENLKKSPQILKFGNKFTSATSDQRHSVIVEPISITPHFQSHSWSLRERDVVSFEFGLMKGRTESFIKHTHLTREERLSQRKMRLRHQAQQCWGFQQHRTTERSKIKFNRTIKLLKRLNRSKDESFKRTSQRTCQFENCKNEVIMLTNHCGDHILMADKEQHLIRQCCFLYNTDAGQCRVPIYDVLANVAVCKDHRDAPSLHLLDPTKPKKTQNARTKSSRTYRQNPTVIRPVKKNGKVSYKKKTTVATTPAHRPTMIIHPNDIQKKQPMKLITQHQQQSQLSHSTIPLIDNHQFIHQNSGNVFATSQSAPLGNATHDDSYLKQDLMTICENSYESSEDTGVGGLSESELMSNDVIGQFDIESCAELTKVLSSLPTNTLDDLLTEPLQTSRDDEEYLDRAIEEVSAGGMDQIAITAFDHLEGLGDMLELMDDEQRQMISAATNLISMSNFLSNHDQDYSAMPSPMMS